MFYNQKNACVFVGNLGSDPEERETSTGKVFARFSIAVNEKMKVQDEWEDKTTWVPCVLFGNGAEPFLEYVGKGDKVMITCKYQTYSYEDNDTGETKYGHNFQVVSWDKLTPRKDKDTAKVAVVEEEEEYDEEFPF